MATKEWEKRILDGRTWDAFCDRLKRIGAFVDRDEIPGDVETRALGYRFLTRVLRAGLERNVDYADPQYPAFYRVADETKKILNDNPDNLYQTCEIDSRFDYRIAGSRGTVGWFSIGAKGGAGTIDGMTSTGEIDSSQIRFESDGRFEVFLSRSPQLGNWLRLTEDSTNLVVRQTFGDRSKEKPAELAIECLNPERPNNVLDPSTFEESLESTLHYLESTVELGLQWTGGYKRSTLNRLPMHDQAILRAAGGDPTICYYQSHWALGPDEALQITIEGLPDCATWNFQLSNFWMESLEHRFFDISVNKFTARSEEDGTVRMLVAHADPGPAHPNWLNTLGYAEGGMLGRIVGASSGWPREWRTEVVAFADVAS